VVELPWAADSCPCVEKLRTVLPLTVGIRDRTVGIRASVVQLVSILGGVVSGRGCASSEQPRCTALTSLESTCCKKVTDAGLRAAGPSPLRAHVSQPHLHVCRRPATRAPPRPAHTRTRVAAPHRTPPPPSRCPASPCPARRLASTRRAPPAACRASRTTPGRPTGPQSPWL
jgi:hypothetical protein